MRKRTKLTRLRVGGLVALMAMTVLNWGATQAPALTAPARSDVLVELPGLGQDLELDPARDQLYVSIPSTSEIIVVSMSTYQIIDSIFVGQAPHGIDLSEDGSTLFVALNTSGSVAYLDIDTRTVTTVDVNTELGSPLTWDVIEGKPNRVYVSANPGSGGFAWIVQIKTDAGDEASRVASNAIIRCAPVFEDSPDDAFLYIGECFSPESLYKLDLSQDDAPIILEDEHGSVSGTYHLEVNPDGTRIFLASGQVLRTSSFTQVGLISVGPSQVSEDGALAYVATPPNVLAVHDTNTFLQVDSITLPSCDYEAAKTLRLLAEGSGFLVLADDILCGMTEVVPASIGISPPTGQYLSTQAFDLALIVETGGSSIRSLTLTANGKDLTRRFKSCAIQGRTDAGAATFRCPAVMLAAGTWELVTTVRLRDGRTLSDSATLEVVETTEAPGDTRSGRPLQGTP